MYPFWIGGTIAVIVIWLIATMVRRRGASLLVAWLGIAVWAWLLWATFFAPESFYQDWSRMIQDERSAFLYAGGRIVDRMSLFFVFWVSNIVIGACALSQFRKAKRLGQRSSAETS